MSVATDKMKIGVVILNYNSAKDTAKCVEFLQGQKFDREQGVGSREQEFKVSCEQTPSGQALVPLKQGDNIHIIVVDNSDREHGVGSREQLFLTSEVQSYLCQSVEQCSKQGLERAHQKKGEIWKKREYSQTSLDYAERRQILERSEKNQKDLCNLWEKKQIEFIRAEENRGYSAGNNIGLRRAVELGCDYVLVVNPDMEIPDPHYIEKLVAVIQENEDVVVAATDIVTPEGVHQNPMLPDGNWRTSFGWVTSLLRPQKRAEAYDFIGDYAVSGYCAKVSGCCLMLRCSFLQEIGYFDEYPFLYCEEAILASQVARAGKRMYYLANTQAVHRHIKSEKGDPVKRFKHWQRSRIYFYKKYSSDSWLGRQISILSMRMYVLAYTVYKRFISR